MNLLGIDIGSRNVKVAVEKSNQPIEYFKVPTADFYKRYLKRDEHHKMFLDMSALNLPQVDHVASTGYGRHNLGFESVLVISEIQAHTLGASSLTAWDEFLLLDLGGQDTKVILVKEGHIDDFQINDKCAAGSGRYLENMAQVLGVELGELFRHYLDPADLSTTCATYAESELIGKIADGIPVEQLCAGVNHSTFLKIRPMLEHWSVKKLFFVGGGAKNSALTHYLTSNGYHVTIPEQPEYTGALGCLNYIKQEITHAC